MREHVAKEIHNKLLPVSQKCHCCTTIAVTLLLLQICMLYIEVVAVCYISYLKFTLSLLSFSACSSPQLELAQRQQVNWENLCRPAVYSAGCSAPRLLLEVVAVSSSAHHNLQLGEPHNAMIGDQRPTLRDSVAGGGSRPGTASTGCRIFPVGRYRWRRRYIRLQKAKS